MKIISKLWGILTGLLVIGIIVYIGLLWVTSQNITADLEALKSITYNPGKNIVETCFIIQVNNTGYIDVTIEKLYYKIYVNGQYLGEGTKEGIVIKRGINELDICLKSTPTDIIRTIIATSLLKREIVNITIEGYIDIPIKSFGLIKLWTLELPYHQTFQVKITKT